ncbi:MAG TPA: carbohydrate ABC transporter permease [Caproicibacter sp.]|nr:carbohydrate ABC transporter permease [Caproicibacter sp.]
MHSSIAGNEIKKSTNIVFNIVFIILSIICIVPLIFVISISFSSENSVVTYGYSLWPREWSLSAYQYVVAQSTQLLDAYGISIFTTVVGTLLGIFLNSSMGYVLSRRNYKFNKFFTYMILITMLFNGGMISFYLVVSRFLNLNDNVLALILPGSVSAFNIIVMRTFIRQSVPDSCIESASIDGASQLKIFFRIVMPMSLPAMATIGLFMTIFYWNSWFNAMLFINDPALMPLQEFMMNILQNIQFLAQNMSAMGSNSMDALSNLPQQTAQMAIVVLSTLPIVCSYPFFQRYFISGLTIGAVKG